MKEKAPSAKIKEARVRSEGPSALTNRSFKSYEELLGIDRDQLRGKKILDLGSGKYEFFSKDVADLGGEVISMSPSLKNGKPIGWETSYFDQNWQGKSVAGRAQELPFKNDTFDYVAGLFSVPYYLPRTEKGEINYFEYRKTIKEIIRTLKPGGTALIYPIWDTQEEISKKVIKDFADKAEFTFVSIHDRVSGDNFRLVITKKS